MTRSLRQQVELVLSLAKRDLKTRYKDSIFGFLWSLFRPAFLTLILWLVFSHIVPVPFPDTKVTKVPYWLHVLVSIVVWNFFVGSLHEAANSVIAHANLIKKVRLDSEVFPIAAIVANGVHFALALAVVLLIMLLSGHLPPLYILLLPLMVGILVLFTLGLSLYLSALNVLYRDVGSALELVVLAWFYVTPLIYALPVAENRITHTLGAGWFKVYMLNPMTPIVTAIRKTLLYGSGAGEMIYTQLATYLGIALVVSVVLTLTGFKLFHKLSDRFADEL